jgi:hypothetical protein
MARPASKWQLHLQITGVLAALVGLAVHLANDRHGIVLIIALVLHVFVSSLVVACAGDRRGVVHAHVLSPAALAATLVFQWR